MWMPKRMRNNTFVLDFMSLLPEETFLRIKENLQGDVFSETVIYEDGKMHSLPVYRSGPMVFYNKSMLDELQMHPPPPGMSWRRWPGPSRRSLMCPALPRFPHRHAQMLLMQNGSGYIDMENKKVVIDNEKAAERIQWFGDLVQEGVFSLNPTGQYFSNDFNSKLVGLYFGSVAGYKYIIPDGFELGVAPAVNDEVKLWYPSWNRSAIGFKHGEAADKATADFIAFFTNAENSVKYAIAVGALTPYKDGEALPEYQAYLADGSLLWRNP